jgi:transmembrane sensor
MESSQPPYRISSLIVKELEETISEAEKQELNDWINASQRHRDLFDQLTNAEYIQKVLRSLQNFDTEKAKQQVFERIGKQERTKLISLSRWIRYGAAAVFFAVVGISAYLYSTKKAPAVPATNISRHERDILILPGTDKAVLTLSDGRSIALDSAKGTIKNELNLPVSNETGKLVYLLDNPANEHLAPLHLLTIGRGGQYQLTLSDGTKVWLNAASSIRFPAFFTGRERRVEISGEAYFEVAHEQEHPFLVSVRGMEVEVLGTYFNTNAYEEEPVMSTTLLEGSVSIHHSNSHAVLKPGQQVRINSAGKIVVESNVDLEEVVAWKNGLFDFNRADIATIMRQISRWYNVEVMYSGKIPPKEFVGKLSRHASLKEVLHLLELSDVHFKVEGKKIIVTP